MNTKAKTDVLLNVILTPEEYKLISTRCTGDIVDTPIVDLTVWDLHEIWMYIVRFPDGICPPGNFISFAWEEIVKRCQMMKIYLF